MRSERQDRCASPRCRHSGVPVPTIKYCLREGPPRPGELTSPDQAQYDESHLRQLQLIRALAEAGGLSIAHRRPARRQRIAGNQPARRARQGAVRHDPPVRAPRRRRVPAGRRPPGRRAHPRPRLAGQAGHPGPGTAHRRPGRPCATWARTDLLAWPTPAPGPPGRSPLPTWPRSTDGGAWTASSKGSSSAPPSVTSCPRRCGAWPGRTRPHHSGSGRHATGDRRPAEASQKAGAGSPSRVRIPHPIPDRQNR